MIKSHANPYQHGLSVWECRSCPLQYLSCNPMGSSINKDIKDVLYKWISKYYRRP